MAVVQRLELGVGDGHVLLDGLSGANSIVANVAANLGHDVPVQDGDGETGEEEEQGVPCLEAEVEGGQDLCEKPRNDEDDAGEVVVGEGSRRFKGHGRVGNGSAVRHPDADLGVVSSAVVQPRRRERAVSCAARVARSELL